MSDYLYIEDAKKLIEFINTTNYKLAAFEDGVFNSKKDAIKHIESSEYDPESPLNVCFDTKQGNYTESAAVSFDGTEWHVDDYGMGGLSASGNSIEEALIAFRNKHDLNCAYSPIELLVDKENSKQFDLTIN